MAAEKAPIELRFEGGSITDKTFAQVAESVLTMREGNQRVLKPLFLKKLTNSKLRNIYGLITNLYMRVATPEDFDGIRAELQIIKVRIAYEAGRDDDKEKPVRTFIVDSHLMQMIDSIQSYEQFQLYCRYAESLIAYFKFYGGKDK